MKGEPDAPVLAGTAHHSNEALRDDAAVNDPFELAPDELRQVALLLHEHGLRARERMQQDLA
jgi:hypothetical protein